MDVAYAINLIRAWIARRAAKGEHPNADEIWHRINTKYPKAEAHYAERIFQAVG